MPLRYAVAGRVAPRPARFINIRQVAQHESLARFDHVIWSLTHNLTAR